MPYNFDTIGPVLFEEMVRSLIYGMFGLQSKPYGGGPDGQRDFVVEGPIKDSAGVELTGKIIGQVKYKNITTSKQDYAWLVEQINKELKGFQEKGEFPDNYLFYTNIVLTPKKDTGIRDKIDKYVSEHKGSIKGFYVKGYDDICAMLDNNRNVARAYRHFITPGDTLTEFMENMEGQSKNVHLPDGNVIHNGHIVYFPSLLEATPFNYIYFLVSEKQKGIAASLEELLRQYSGRVHVWREYTVQSFLEGTIETLNEGNKEGMLIYMEPDSVNNIERLIHKWKRAVGANPMVINVCAKGRELTEIAERIKAILEEIDWGQKFNKKKEIESLILIQTDRVSMRQNVESVDKIGRDQLEHWRILLSDRYYFKQVLNCCGKPLAKHLLCQRIPVCKGVEDVEADRRLLERYDRERFIRQKYLWEDE